MKEVGKLGIVIVLYHNTDARNAIRVAGIVTSLSFV
jgi:hypothetical protein